PPPYRNPPSPPQNQSRPRADRTRNNGSNHAAKCTTANCRDDRETGIARSGENSPRTAHTRRARSPVAVCEQSNHADSLHQNLNARMREVFVARPPLRHGAAQTILTHPQLDFVLLAHFRITVIPPHQIRRAFGPTGFG